MEQNIDKKLNCVIKRTLGFNQKPQEIARVQINEKGLTYKMLVIDRDIEQILLEIQGKGGIFCRIPFTKTNGNTVIRGQKREFVLISDTDHIIDAIQENLKTGIIEKE